MSQNIFVKSALASALLMVASASNADSGNVQAQLDALKEENKVIMERLNASMDMIESGASAEGGMGGGHGHGSKGKTTVGGYGEMHLNYTQGTKTVDMHRFILYLGHEFNDKIRFFSETEVEHAKVTAGGGEVAIEQAFLEFDVADRTAIRAGVLLVPMGIINETHEPPTFYGVERNNVEKNIIPSTWREGGVSVTGYLTDSVSYDVVLHSGLSISSGDSFKVRGGRNAVRNAPANNPAVTARVKWTGIAGLEIGGGVQQQTDITQGTDATAGAATLFEAHTIYQHNKFGLRALYATWNLTGTGPQAIGADKQTGWYVEPSYKLTEQWGVFARQSGWNNKAGTNGDSAINSQTDAGISYWPHEDVVIKANLQKLKKQNGKDDNGVLMGIGYQF